MLKRLWAFVKSMWAVIRAPSVYFSLGFLTLGGFVAGVLFWGAFNTAMELTNTETFCTGCHEMNDNVFAELKAEHLRVKRVEAVLSEDGAELDLPGVEALPSKRHHAAFRVDTTVTPVDRVVAELVRGASVLDLTISAPRLETVIATLYEGDGS